MVTCHCVLFKVYCIVWLLLLYACTGHIWISADGSIHSRRQGSGDSPGVSLFKYIWTLTRVQISTGANCSIVAQVLCTDVTDMQCSNKQTNTGNKCPAVAKTLNNYMKYLRLIYSYFIFPVRVLPACCIPVRAIYILSTSLVPWKQTTR